MSILVTELAEHSSLVNFIIEFLHGALRVYKVRTLRSMKQVDHRFIARRPIQLHEIVFVEPYRIRVSCWEVRTKLVAASLLLRRVWQHELLDGVLEGRQHGAKVQSPENDLGIMQSFVAHDFGSSKGGVKLGTLLVALVHIRVEMINQRLHSNEPCYAIGPGLSALVWVDVGDEKAWNGDAVLDGSDVLAELRVD